MNRKLRLNKELKKSILTNELIINISTYDYEKIKYLINKYKTEYEKNKMIIVKKDGFEKIYLHNKLVKNIIYDILNSFDEIQKHNVCVFLTGSFARNTNKLNSDLDLHFCYSDKYKSRLFKCEEMIYFVLLNVFDLPRGKVHNMILSRINPNAKKILKKKLDDKELKIVLKSESQKFEYVIDGNTKDRIYLQYGNSRSLKGVFKYLKREVGILNREWCHVFYTFTMKDKFMMFYRKLYLYEKRKINNKFILKRKQRIKNYICEINLALKNAKRNSMSDFKKIFQMKEFKIIYELISSVRDYNLLNKKEWLFINFANNKEDLMEIWNDILDYFNVLFKVVEPFKSKYSIHKDIFIDTKIFDLLENKLLILNKKMGDYIWKD